MRCDLHIHSLFSDGTASPSEIIAEAKKLGLTVALTDHNTVLGCREFLLEAEKNGVCAVAGTELSTAHGDKELHLIGLFISPDDYDKVEDLAKEFHVLKEISNMEMIERMNAAGYDIDYISVKRRNPLGNANRAHMAAELMEKGYVKSIGEAFKTILNEERGFYVPPARLMLCDAIKFLREIKAVPIIAHPLQDLNEDELTALLPSAIEVGLLGIEVYHSSYSEEQIKAAISIADKFGLYKSGGSDYHGANKPSIFLGVGKGNLDIPVSVFEELSALHSTL